MGGGCWFCAETEHDTQPLEHTPTHQHHHQQHSAKADLAKATDPFQKAVLDGRQLALKVRVRASHTGGADP